MLFTGKKNVVRSRRIYMNLTQEELAQKIGVSKNLIRLYEKQECSIKYTYAKKLAELFGISIKQLFE